MNGLPSRRCLLGGLVLAALSLGGCHERPQTAADQAPELVATTLDGRVVRLADLRGKTVLINFWLGGCGPCLAEMNELDGFYRAHRARGLEVLAVNMGQSKETVTQAAGQMQVSFPLLIDPLKITITRYKVSAAQTSFIVNPQGRLVERIDGPLNRALLSAKFKALL